MINQLDKISKTWLSKTISLILLNPEDYKLQDLSAKSIASIIQPELFYTFGLCSSTEDITSLVESEIKKLDL